MRYAVDMDNEANPPALVALFSDFGVAGPYQGEMTAALYGAGNRLPVVDLMRDAPTFDARASGCLLAALSRHMPPRTLFLCVVDPGVGGERRALVVRSAGHWFVGPDNGLLAPVAGVDAEVAVVDWRPARLSATFHGRDLFAPVAAAIGRGESVPSHPLAPAQMVGHGCSPELAEVIYLDGYGNAWTGLHGPGADRARQLWIGAHRIGYAETFCRVPPGTPFWYENANGLVEIAVNGDSAAARLGVAPGDPVGWLPA